MAGKQPKLILRESCIDDVSRHWNPSCQRKRRDDETGGPARACHAGSNARHLGPPKKGL